MSTNSTLSQYISSLSPIVYWKLDETSGSTFAQTGSSTAAALTVGAGTSVVTSDAQLLPNDTTKFVTINPAGYLEAAKGNVACPIADLSWSAIIKIYPPFNSQRIAFLNFGGSGETTATNYQLQASITTAGKLTDFSENGAGVNTDIVCDSPIDPRVFVASNTFVLTAVRNTTSKVQQFYINGRLHETVSYSANSTGGTSSVFTVGSSVNDVSISIGHVCLFNRQLTSVEVFNIADAAQLADSNLGIIKFPSESSTTSLVQTLFTETVTKSLLSAVDPLIDISVAFPDNAYNIE